MWLKVRFLHFPNLNAPPAPAWLGIAVLFIAALAASSVAGGLVGAVALLVAGASILVCVRQAASEDARFVFAAVGFAFVLRALLASILDIALTQQGRAGALFLDDGSYLRTASQLADSWRNIGQPFDIDPTQGGNYVRVAAALFFLFGPSAIVLKLMNTALGVLVGLLVYRSMVNLRLPGPRIGLLLTLFFPSLVLWSMLALKDAYVLFFAVAPIWLMTEYKRTRRLLPWFPLIVASMLAIENVRVYVYLILLVAWPLSTPFLVGRKWWLKPTALDAALAALLLATTPALTYLNPNIVTASTYIRQAMAFGARSGFVEPLPVVRGNPGDRFVISAVGRSPEPEAQVRTIEVQQGQSLVLEGSGSGGEIKPNEVQVRPGDVIVIVPSSREPGSPTGTPESTSPHTATPAVVTLTATGRNVVGSPSPSPPPPGSSEDALVVRGGILDAVRYLPVGVFHLMTAPIPLTSTSLIDVAAIPEMLLWYVCQLLALWGFASLVRQRRFEFAYGVLVLGGIGLTLSLFEGNIGTLLRHRAMLIPFIAILAAVGTTEALKHVPYQSSARRLD
jgi:hypothetical protein